MMFCGNMRPALRSLDFLDASPRSRTVLGRLSVPGLSAWRLEGRFFPSDIQGLKILPRLQPHPWISHTQDSSGRASLARQPRGKVPVSPGCFECLNPACCGLAAPRPPLASPRPRQRICAQPGTPSLGGAGADPRGWRSRSGPGRSLASWPNSLRCPRAGPGRLSHGESPRGLRDGKRGTPRPAAPLPSTRS